MIENEDDVQQRVAKAQSAFDQAWMTVYNTDTKSRQRLVRNSSDVILTSSKGIQTKDDSYRWGQPNDRG